MSSLVGFALFFGIWLLPYVFPDLDGTREYELYIWSSTLVAMFLAMVAGISAAVALAAGLLRWPILGRTLGVLRWSATGLAVCLVVQAFVIAVPKRLPSGADSQRFAHDAWRAPGADEREGDRLAPRQTMVRDIVDNVLPGRTKAEIEAALGASEPTVLDGYLNRVPFKGGDLNYHLSADARNVGSNDQWLFVWLDGNGRFDRYHVAKMSGVPEMSTTEKLTVALKLLVLGLAVLVLPMAVLRWKLYESLGNPVAVAAAVCSAPLLVVAFVHGDGSGNVDLGTYFALKVLSYSAWSWLGLRLLTSRESVVEGVALGFLRTAIGLGFGVLIWQASTRAFVAAYPMVDDYVLAQAIAYIAVYLPSRWLEWGLLEAAIRRSAGAWILQGADPTGRQWRAGGIAVSCAADVFLVVELGRLPLGRLIC